MILEWRDANLRSGADKKELQRFRCTDDVLRQELTALGLKDSHPRMWEWHVQQLIQDKVRALKASRWIVRLGFDTVGLGAVMVAEEIDAGHIYDATVGAIASRLRRRHLGDLGNEMLEDLFRAIGDRCLSNGYSGEVQVTGLIHRDNQASKRMCDRNGFIFVGQSAVDPDHEDWARPLAIPGPELF